MIEKKNFLNEFKIFFLSKLIKSINDQERMRGLKNTD